MTTRSRGLIVLRRGAAGVAVVMGLLSAVAATAAVALLVSLLERRQLKMRALRSTT